MSVLHGSSPDVGVVGYSLGGGIGWQVRSRGLATNSITAIELVTADGEQARADATTEPDLFWAMRGGGGNFGIVTALEIEMFPLETVYAGWLIWPWEQSHAALSRWAEWIQTVPDEMTSVGRILRLPPLEMIPEPLRGRDIVVVEIAYNGADGSGEELVRPLRELKPEMDTVDTAPVTVLSRLHQDPEGATPAFVDHLLLDSVGSDGVDAFVGAVGPDSGSPILSTEIRHLGGAAGIPAPGGGALSHMDAEFLTAAISIPGDDDLNAAILRQFGIYHDAMRPFSSGRQYLNFVENETDPRGFYPARTHRRLAAIKAKVDPTGVFHANHHIDAA
jgi:FAD/FMN-containing dehydrogenase